MVSYESIREWGLRFGRIFANMPRRRRPQPGDKWYMHEVFIRIRGKKHYLWRAVDQDGSFRPGGRISWQPHSGYCGRSPVETAMYRYKTIIGRRPHARTLSNQRTEAKIGC